MKARMDPDRGRSWADPLSTYGAGWGDSESDNEQDYAEGRGGGVFTQEEQNPSFSQTRLRAGSGGVRPIPPPSIQ